ncbi:MAG: RNA methyltransferase [Myxococcales bacterium]|nr:RNA methyltransferase [Myxococcales bacterium]
MTHPCTPSPDSRGLAAPRRVAVALVHHPVRDRNEQEIAASVDWVDFFDAGRVTLVYGVNPLYVVHPVESQKALVERLITHGTKDDRTSETRGRFDHAVIVDSLDECLAHAEGVLGGRPLVVATTARRLGGQRPYAQVRASIDRGEPVLLLFGKASGLSDSVFERSDAVLEPLSGGTGFDHLPVRGAFAIVLDRLLASDRHPDALVAPGTSEGGQEHG